MHRTSSRVGLRGTLVALAALVLLVWAGAPSQAADAYRYWSYWWGNGGDWEFAQTGPADRVVSDGDVEGWRYLVSADAVPADQPSSAPDFADVCGAEQQTPGNVRVAVVIDNGAPDTTPAGSTYPSGQQTTATCVIVPEGSTGEQALAAAAEVRSEQGATCGIDGYPASGCFEVVAVPLTTSQDAATPQDAAATETAPQQESGSASWLWLLAGGAAVVAAGALFVTQRNRKTPAA